jgi:uncharacterized repeat protein (TIGR01451 family)
VRRAAGALAIAVSILAAAPAFAATTFKQPGFSEAVVLEGLDHPSTLRFLPDGRVLVAEKSGLIKMFDSVLDPTPTTVVDLRTQVHNFWDRGLLGLAVDPDFAGNGYVYALYTHDAAIGGVAPRWGPGDGTSDPCPTPPGATTDGCVVSGRLSRLTASGSDWTASEHVLIEDWCQQFPSHTVGALSFGVDGYLYISAGEGASFDNQDWGQFGGTADHPPTTPKNPCGDPPVPVGGNQVKPTAEGGALRAQSPRRAAGEPRVLNGSILRVDPATGEGAPGNPFAGSSDADERRIIGFGFRNPFRMIVKPGTNDVWIGDVGWNDWEEIDRIPDLTTARNFGWPCFEGPGPEYSGLNICPDSDTNAVFQYNHASVAVGGDGCPAGGSSISGLAFYQGGANYPAEFQNALFFADYTRTCIWVMFPFANGDPNPAAAAPFAASAQSPVDLQTGPDGFLYYVDFNGGRILRVVYGLHAVASANPTSGPVPLSVQFDSTGTTAGSPGDTLAYAWDLDGDGQFDDSNDPAPSFVYTSAGTYSARLRVTDPHGGFDISAPVTINAGNDAPTATILTPSASLTWKVGDPISFSGAATDPQDGELPPSALSWSVIIHHCPSTCHTHVYQTFAGVAGGSFVAPEHEYPAYLEIQLTATDSGSVMSTASVNLNPQTVALKFQSVPPGLLISSGTLTQPAPFTQTVIVNAQDTIIAPTQGGYPTTWEFVAWSDGGAQSHTITTPAAPATYTATFTAYADLSIAISGVPDSICEGQALTYTLDIANAGPSRASAVTVTDTLPPGATLVSAGGDGWTCGGEAVVTCTRPVLDIGKAPPVAIVVMAAAGTAQNAAAVTGTTTDPVQANDTASASTTVLAAPPAPVLTAPNSATVGATGLTASVPDHPGSTYAWTLTGGTITSGQGTPQITFDAGPPGTTMVLQVTESAGDPCASLPATAHVQVDYLDVSPSHPFHDFVNAIARAEITVGCGGGNFCPDRPNTRAEMAVFLLKSKFGSTHVPPPATGAVFGDVPASNPFAPWIEELASLGITSGCGGGNYCPGSPVTRAQTAVFLLKTYEGSDYEPPPATGALFDDVPGSDPFAGWIEELFSRGITGGCQTSPPLYCPQNSVTRGQMAVFLSKTFGF